MSLTDSQQVLERIARQGPGPACEGSIVASPGGGTAAWAVKVKSKVAYNVYMVRAVVIGDTGSIPVEIGEQVEAVNLAESFLNEGTLPAGKYGVMVRVGEKNMFYSKP
jgi:hypothetical protein